MLLILASLLIIPLSDALCPVYTPPSMLLNRATDPNYFLPKNIKPLRYEITLEPNLEQGTLKGNVIIDLRALENTNNITLQLRYVTIDNSSLQVLHSSGEILHVSPSWENYTELYTVNLSEELVANEEYKLIADYDGLLHTDNGGFYLGRYEDEAGNERLFATTQFESTNARRAFPCLDEPALKATFVVHIIRPEEYTSISNEVLIGTDNVEGKFKDNYKETVTMSTYLAAFVVSDFQNISYGNQRVFARPSAIKEGLADHALRSGIGALNLIGDFVGVNYNQEKLDQIAFPDDYFAAGAMENWGLVTYRESYLLYSKERSLTSELQRVTTVISHELAHQWFGNLVTLAWWDSLWLNEGFATYFEWFTTSQLYPEWRMMDQFIVAVVQYALDRDSYDNTEAMNYATEYPGGGPPSWVAYQKAGSVIRMFEHFVTTEVFRRALTIYLTNHQFDVVIPGDLYEALQQVLTEYNKNDLLGNEDVSSILTTWDTLKGYPLVTAERNYDNGNLVISQKKFLMKDANSDTSDIWYIPINIASNANDIDFSRTTAELWLNQKQQTVNYGQSEGWIILNKQVTGFYRVNYDDTNWNRIIDYLNSDDYDKIHILNRAQLVDDSFNLARSGLISYTIPLTLSQYLTRETDYVPFYPFLLTVDFLNKQLASEDEYEYFQNYVLSLLQTAYEHLGVEELETDSHTDKMNRASILRWLCNFGDSDCRATAVQKFKSWMDDGTKISPNLQSAFFCSAMYEASEEEWNFLYSKYEETPIVESSLRTRILNGLGCTQNDDLIKKFLRIAVDTSSTLESKHRTTVFSSVYNSGKKGLSAAFEYLSENFDDISNSVSLSTVLNGIASLFTTDDQLAQLKVLQSQHTSSNIDFGSAIGTVEENIKWITENTVELKSWLAEYYRSSGLKIETNLVLLLAGIIIFFVVK